MGDVNHVHPFREENGRTHALYLQQLAEQAGHPLNLATLDGAASIAAHGADYSPMRQVIKDALERSGSVARDQGF